MTSVLRRLTSASSRDAHRLGEAGLDVGELVEHRVEVLGADPHDLHVIERDAGGGAHALAQQADLAEVVGAVQVAQHEVAAREGLRDLDEADADQEEAVGRVALPADHLSRLVAHHLDAVAQPPHEGVAEAGQQRHGAQVRVERPLAVAPVEIGLEHLVLLEHLQDVAQDLENFRLLDRPHGGRARIEGQARHLAEEVARPQLGHRVAELEVDGGVDGDVAGRARCGRLRSALHQLGQHVEEALAPAALTGPC